MKKYLIKIVAGIALLLGLMAVFSGTRVLTGYFEPGYNVLPWLVYYNVFMGLVSLFAAFLIWKENAKALLVSGIITAGHISVLFSLLTIFSSVVATHSIKAMTFRSSIWLILILVVWKKVSKK